MKQNSFLNQHSNKYIESYIFFLSMWDNLIEEFYVGTPKQERFKMYCKIFLSSLFVCFWSELLCSVINATLVEQFLSFIQMSFFWRKLILKSYNISGLIHKIRHLKFWSFEPLPSPFVKLHYMFSTPLPFKITWQILPPWMIIFMIIGNIGKSLLKFICKIWDY